MDSSVNPAVFTIAPGQPFLDRLAAGILARWGETPQGLGQVTVLLPTRRACRALAEAFLRARDGAALLLPVIRPLGDVDEDELDIRGLHDTTGALPFPPLDRSLLLARLVMASPLAGDPANALRLARQLGDLLDAAATEETGLDRLPDLVTDIDLARHWEQTLQFLQVIRTAWPAIKAERQRLDAAEHRQQAMQAWIAHWQQSPPAGPVIAAGSTGTIPATARLLKLVARLPQGAVVLPGLDTGIDDAAWSAVRLEPTHPQHTLARLLETLGVLRSEVKPWPPAADSDPARIALLSQAMLPPGETHRWRSLPPAAGAAFAGLQRIEAPGLQEEALAIALALRETLQQPGRTAALITPDRNLARRVAAELGRYGIDIDDSAGQPLAQTPPAVFLRLLAAAAAADFAALPLLSLLKHPFCRLGQPRTVLLRWARRLERKCLRGARPGQGLDALAEPVQADPALIPLFHALQQATAPLRAVMRQDGAMLSDLLKAQIAAAEMLAVGPEDEAQPVPLWLMEAGESLHAAMVDLLQAEDALGPIAPAQWPRLFDALLEGGVVRPRFGKHPRLFIWGLLEARLQHADRIILGGLNEGTWPPQAEEDPWLSRPMRDRLGLPPPERRLGQTAHDFMQAACGSDVILSRAAKVDGTPTVPARWLLRLDALLKDDPRWKATAAPHYLDWVAALDRPAATTRSDPSKPNDPPKPAPPLAARPRSLFVTDIETWIRDPYALYAKRILGLRKLDPVDQPPDARLRGNIIHDVLDSFLKRHPDTLPDEEAAVAELLALGRDAFGAWLEQPAIATLWWPRFERAMRWFAGYERERRAAGFHPALLEREGRLDIAAPGGSFALRARADRIDRRASDGALAVLDYKTGNPPGVKEVNAGLAPQLPLEAAIAHAGGFEDLAAGEIAELVYVSLRGGAEPGRAVPIEGRDIPSAADLAAQTLDYLQSWVAHFDNPQTPYLSRPRPKFVRYPGDYDHLARVAERAEGSGDES